MLTTQFRPTAPLPSADMHASVREYGRGDYHACRRLWAELTEHHRQIWVRMIGARDRQG